MTEEEESERALAPRHQCVHAHLNRERGEEGGENGNEVTMTRGEQQELFTTQGGVHHFMGSMRSEIVEVVYEDGEETAECVALKIDNRGRGWNHGKEGQSRPLGVGCLFYGRGKKSEKGSDRIPLRCSE